jgi:cyanate lyase
MAKHSNLNAEIAQRVRRAAANAEITHQDLALRIGWADRTLSRYLAGQADWKVVQVQRVAAGIDGSDFTYLLTGLSA